MKEARPFRSDIQGLRAVAVALVFGFHLFPEFLTGGYVGVDVFFVISGYLITGLLIEEVDRDGTIDLARFYLRRIRRLLPAATVVLVACGAASFALLPDVRWEDAASHIVASALYVENFLLAAQSVDYLAENFAPSPFQHYWSLSIEEQFYIFWPLWIMAAAALGGRLGAQNSTAIRMAIVSMLAASLVFSIVEARSAAPSPSHYFETHKRVWELALGGAAATFRFTPPFGDVAVALIKWAGFLAILASAFLLSASTVFPGYAALPPTGGAAALLVVGASRSRFAPDRFLSRATMQWIGDHSYAIYLWHWPLIVFLARYRDGGVSLATVSIIVFLTLLLAAASKRWIEDPFRREQAARRILGRAALLTGASLAVASALAAPALLGRNAPGAVADVNHPGAAVLVTPQAFSMPAAVDLSKVKPALLQARHDLPDVYKRKCHVQKTDPRPFACRFEYGEAKTVLLVGDSHAAMWLPALQIIAQQRGWTLISHTKSSCAFVDAPTAVDTSAGGSCRAWTQTISQALRETPPDLIITAIVANARLDNDEAATPGSPAKPFANALAQTWAPLIDSGARVLAIRSTPIFDFDVAECLSATRDSHQCARPRAAVERSPDPMEAAAGLLEGATIADLNDAICSAQTCRPIVGRVMVYRDQHHLTATYVRTLAPYLERAVDDALDAARPSAPSTTKATATPTR